MHVIEKRTREKLRLMFMNEHLDWHLVEPPPYTKALHITGAIVSMVTVSLFSPDPKETVGQQYTQTTHN